VGQPPATNTGAAFASSLLPNPVLRTRRPVQPGLADVHIFQLARVLVDRERERAPEHPTAGRRPSGTRCGCWRSLKLADATRAAPTRPDIPNIGRCAPQRQTRAARRPLGAFPPLGGAAAPVVPVCANAGQFWRGERRKSAHKVRTSAIRGAFSAGGSVWGGRVCYHLDPTAPD
jgi:hypothetical protein